MEVRVFVLAPSGKDAQLIGAALERSSIATLRCASVADVIERSGEGIGALLVAEEALGGREGLQLQRYIERQPTWSDLPVLLLTARAGRLSELAAGAAQRLGNVTVLERPTQVATLVSAVRTALRTRQRQYEIRAADARKDLFLATLAHELRNPLAPLSNALHLLCAPTAGTEQRRWATGVMQRQVGQLSRLVDDLLDVARITAGKITLQKELLDLREVIHAAAESTLPQVQAMEHTLQIDLPESPLWVEGDRIRLVQCVANLLSNAAKYTPHGGLIRVSAEQRSDEITLQVRDNGIGFPPQEARRLFEIFSQVDGAAPRAQGGLGLGLSIVKALVEMHGGSVQAQSQGANTGAVFSLRVPPALAPRPVPHGQLSEEREAGGRVTGRVLVVDDNRDSADSMGEMLRMLGHDVRVAYDAASAMARLDGWVPQLALLDIGLPDVSGHELARTIRAHLGERCPVLVAVTGWGQAIDIARSADAGFDHHLTKPADMQALLALVEQASGSC